MGPGERRGPERRAVQRSARKFSTVFLWRQRPGMEGRTVSCARFHRGLFWVQSARPGAYIARFRQEIRRDRKSAPRRTAPSGLPAEDRPSGPPFRTAPSGLPAEDRPQDRPLRDWPS